MSRHISSLGRRILLAALVMLAGCDLNGDRVTPGELRSETKKVALGNAHSVQVKLNMKAGELNVGSGAGDLFEGDFNYNVSQWKPEVNYQVSGGVGNLDVEQPGSSSSTGNTRNEWDVRLNKKTPMEMNVNMGAGRATLTLGGLDLSRLELNIGAGEATVDLKGNWKNDLSAEIHGGVGKATIHLPRDVGVYVVAHGGLGAINAGDLRKQGDGYVNDAYGKSPVTLHVEVVGGVGEINLDLGGEEAAGA